MQFKKTTVVLNELRELPNPAGAVTESCIPTWNSQQAPLQDCGLELHRDAQSSPASTGTSVLRARCCRHFPFKDRCLVALRDVALHAWMTSASIQPNCHRGVHGQSLRAFPVHSEMGILMRPPWPKPTASLLSWEGRCTSLTLPWQKYPLKRQRGFLGTAVWSPANWSGELQNCVDVTCSWNYFLKRFSQTSPYSLFSSFFVAVFFYLFHNLLFTVHPSGDTVELFTINLKYIHLGWCIYGNRLVSLIYITSQSVQITVFYQGKSPELKNV